MRGSDFVFDCANELHKVDLNRGRSYINSPIWLKNKKATINPKNMNDDRCFQYALTVALNYEKIKNHPERTKNIEPFIDQYSWDEINSPSDQKDWKEFESNNKSIALNVLYVPHNTKKIRHAYKSKYNLKREKQEILLMITDGTKWHNLAVKTLSGVLRGITGNNHGDFYYLNCLHSYTTKSRLNKHQKICENYECCKLEMPKKGSVLKYIFGEKSIMTPFVIYADLESILEKISGCENDPEKSSVIKVNKHIASGYSLFSHCVFDKTKNKLDYYTGKNCMKNFSLNLREHAEKIINYEQAKPKKKGSSIEAKKFVIYAKRYLVPKMIIITIIKLKIIAIIQEDIQEQLMLYVVKNVKYQKKYLLCFIMALLMIFILLLKSWLKNLKANLSV